MELLGAIIYLFITFYIYKTVWFVITPYIAKFFYNISIFRNDESNLFLAMMTTILATLVITVTILIGSYLIFHWFSIVLLIALCIFIRVKDIGNPDI